MDLLHEKFLTREYIQTALAVMEDISIEHINEREMIVWDDRTAKVTRFRFLEEMKPEDLAEMISISKDIPKEYQLDKRVLAEYLWNNCDRNAFITLEELVVIWSEPDDEETFEPAGFEDSETRRLCDEYGDEYALELGKDLVGQLWFERNIAVVNMGEIVRSAQQVARENEDAWDSWFSFENLFVTGFLTTVLHELRHVQMDTNIILPENIYPFVLGTEENVEEYCREAFEQSIIPQNLFSGTHQKSLEDSLVLAKIKADDLITVNSYNKEIEPSMSSW